MIFDNIKRFEICKTNFELVDIITVVPGDFIILSKDRWAYECRILALTQLLIVGVEFRQRPYSPDEISNFECIYISILHNNMIDHLVWSTLGSASSRFVWKICEKRP